jgi:glycosyltransferase involved in cell wall biosynthesis
MLESSGWQVQIVLAVHFNGSIADEWAGKGYIARGDRTYRAMVTRDEQVLRAVDRIIFVSEYACREAKLSIAGLDRRKLSVIPNSVYAPPVDDNASLLGDLISIGGFEPRKNQEFLLRVLAAARDRGQIYTLTLVGSGPLQQPLRRLAESLGVSEQVRFPGALPDAAPLISRHRAYVHAALMENLPIVIIEALAAGRPAFAVPVGGIPEIFRDRIEGRMWELHDPDGAAAALISVLGAPDVYAAMAKAARARYEAWFTPEATQPRLLAAVSTEIQESEYLTGPLEPCCKN